MNSILQAAESKMTLVLGHLCGQYESIRADRANPAILDRVIIDYYGTPTPLNQIAAISVAESRIIIIQPWDISLLSVIEKAIQKSDIGINPQNDGKVIRLIFPPLTEDRRKNISKDISQMAEETKVRVRNIRREAMDQAKVLKKNSKITEDELKRCEKYVQDLTDRYGESIDKLCKEKVSQIMTI